MRPFLCLPQMSLGLWSPGEWHPRSLEMRPQLNAPWKQPSGSPENLGTRRDGLGPGSWLSPLLSVLLQVRFRPVHCLGRSHAVTVHGAGPTSLRTGFPGCQAIRAVRMDRVSAAKERKAMSQRMAPGPSPTTCIEMTLTAGESSWAIK